MIAASFFWERDGRCRDALEDRCPAARADERHPDLSSSGSYEVDAVTDSSSAPGLIRIVPIGRMTVFLPVVLASSIAACKPAVVRHVPLAVTP
jgi:hypothetical protein